MAAVSLAKLFLKAGHVQPVWAGHPWVYAQAVARVEGTPEAGAEVLVCDARGQAIGRALYSPASAIVARVFTLDSEVPIDAALFERRLRAAIERRKRLGLPDSATTGFRCIHAEGDGLPGLVVDRLGDVLAVQFATLGLKRRQELILDVLERELAPRAIVDRTSAKAAEREGFVADQGVLRGDRELARFAFVERGLRFEIPLTLGQKTGFYFDQRPLRARIEAVSLGRRVLDAHCYVGGAALSAARGGAREVVAVDTSAPALEVLAECAALNDSSARVRCVQADALRELSRADGSFDIVVCDPPKLAAARHQRGRGADALRRLARAANQAVCDGGLVILSSCSAALGMPELNRALALGARDAGREARVLERLFQGPDHPVPAAFPEGLYLSTLIAESCRVTPN